MAEKPLVATSSLTAVPPPPLPRPPQIQTLPAPKTRKTQASTALTAETKAGAGTIFPPRTRRMMRCHDATREAAAARETEAAEARQIATSALSWVPVLALA